MRNDYTHISVILDRTGSMESIRDDTIGGFNTFLKEQQSAPGTATLTLVQFDTQDPYEVVHRFRPIHLVPELTRETYVPRASTPLLDALGRGINDLEKGLADIRKQDRPSNIVFVVITDGQENSSQEFKKDQIVKMMKERTEKDGWQFVFLSADVDAIADARAMGMRADATLQFEKSAKGTAMAWSMLSASTADLRAKKVKKIGFKGSDRQRPADRKTKKTT